MKREVIASLLCDCLCLVESWIGLHFVIVTSPGHIHLLSDALSGLVLVKAVFNVICR